jgi:hypothetical protein
MSEGEAAEKTEEKAADAKKEGSKKKKEAKGGGSGLTARISSWFSAAGCAAWLTAFFLVLLVIGVWIVFWLDPSNVPWRHAMSWTRIVLIVLLVIAIPLVLYRAIRLWLEGDESAFPDIDFAWRAGMEALVQNGLLPTSAPLFLVLGSAGVRQEDALIKASGLALRIHDVPEGPAPLHWYASPDGIYLVLSESCGLSSLAALLEKRRAQAASFGETGPAPLGHLPPTGEAAPSTPRAAPRPAPQAPRGGSARGTVMLDQFVAEMQAAEAEPTEQAGTSTAAELPPLRESTAVPSTAADQPAILSQAESARQRARLKHVCQLVRHARFPLCPVNGVLLLLPFELLQATQRETQQLQKTTRSDLATLQRELAIRCPVTALVVGMHQERGFRELVRRVGRERATAQRFGRRFDLRTIPTAESISALCALTVGVFEDWIHTLFREAEALSRPGNLRLYGLLCKIRSTLSGVLSDVLVGSVGHDPQSRDLTEPIPFSGCYFAATGQSEDQQAFVRGVFEKLGEEQEEVEWTRGAQANNRRAQIVAASTGVFGGACLIAIVTLAILRALR